MAAGFFRPSIFYTLSLSLLHKLFRRGLPAHSEIALSHDARTPGARTQPVLRADPDHRGRGKLVQLAGPLGGAWPTHAEGEQPGNTLGREEGPQRAPHTLRSLTPRGHATGRSMGGGPGTRGAERIASRPFPQGARVRGLLEARGVPLCTGGGASDRKVPRVTLRRTTPRRRTRRQAPSAHATPRPRACGPGESRQHP
jgi:hypothetical protein